MESGRRRPPQSPPGGGGRRVARSPSAARPEDPTAALSATEVMAAGNLRLTTGLLIPVDAGVAAAFLL
jgi:hypothetical protein